MAQMVKKPLAMQEKTWVRSVGWENPLEKGIPTHTSILAWRRAYQPTLVFLPGESPWTEKPGVLQSTRLQRVGHD